jgi:GTP-binding protein EngB required for normal cell division
MDLSEYDRHKFELAGVLRAAVGLKSEAGGPWRDAVRELFADLAEDRFNIAVVGRFSRGKSSLMNAILGEAWLPTGIAPLTSVVTSLSYGSTPGVELTFVGRSLKQRIDLDALGQYVTQEGNPGNARRVQLAEIQVPAEILRRGFYFVDTPGLGSAIAENTATTEAFLPSADAFVLVTGYESPLSQEEFKFLMETVSSGRRIFVVLNKHDMVTDAVQRDEAQRYVRRQLETIFGEGLPVIYSTSALQGLKAKRANDEVGLRDSGVAALEHDLIRFLLNEKRTHFLSRAFARANDLLQALPHGAETADLIDRLASMRGAAFPTREDVAQRSQIGKAAPSRSEIAGACHVCRAIEAATFEFTRHFQYDITVKPELRAQLAHEGGLCPLHTWTYNAMASPQGVCKGFPEVLEAWADRLMHAARAAPSPADAAELIDPMRPRGDSCQICQACAEAEMACLEATASQLARTKMVDDLSAICLDHLTMLLGRFDAPELAAKLLRREAGLLQRIADDMRRYALKFDGVRRPLASEAEVNAPVRALRALAGLPNLRIVGRSDRLLG